MALDAADLVKMEWLKTLHISNVNTQFGTPHPSAVAPVDKVSEAIASSVVEYVRDYAGGGTTSDTFVVQAGGVGPTTTTAGGFVGSASNFPLEVSSAPSSYTFSSVTKSANVGDPLVNIITGSSVYGAVAYAPINAAGDPYFYGLMTVVP